MCACAPAHHTGKEPVGDLPDRRDAVETAMTSRRKVEVEQVGGRPDRPGGCWMKRRGPAVVVLGFRCRQFKELLVLNDRRTRSRCDRDAGTTVQARTGSGEYSTGRGRDVRLGLF